MGIPSYCQAVIQLKRIDGSISQSPPASDSFIVFQYFFTILLFIISKPSAHSLLDMAYTLQFFYFKVWAIRFFCTNSLKALTVPITNIVYRIP